jgi:DNA-binding transcriptional LysR family regulator
MNRRLDSRALEQFLAVAQALSFRQAAQTLHISQPPLSRAIRELEERLGTRLFERSTRSVALTSSGEILLPIAQRVGRLLDQAEAALLRESRARVLRLGLTSAAEPRWFEGLSARIAALSSSGVRLETVSASSPRLVQQLRSGRLDAAFIALPTQTAGLTVTELERHPMRVALPRSHPLAPKRKLRLSQLRGLRLFWFERARQPAFFDHCQAVFVRHGFSPRSIREPAEHHVLLAEVASGRGFALLPASLERVRRRGVVYRALVEGDELAVGIGLALSTAAARWAPLLLKAARQPAGGAWDPAAFQADQGAPVSSA